ncbi:MAG: glycosyltransferase, partial [Candidatus Cloacimonetes bacterium]|nr:glycosyltransferase [Candidatus Cloacimonadota bacterium]
SFRKLEIKTAFWFVEDYRRFQYWKEYAPLFDLFLTIQRGDFFRELSMIGCQEPYYLPMAASKNVHKPLHLDDGLNKYAADISFMGEGYPNRHNLFMQLLDYDFKLWGTGWENNQAFSGILQKNGERVSIDETVKIYNATKININLHSSMNPDLFEAVSDFINPRTFEIMACGAFQLVDRRDALLEFFIEDEEIVTFSSIQELREKINYYLKNEEERKRIAQNAQRKVLGMHTYQHRLTEIINLTLDRNPELKLKIEHEANEIKEILNKIDDPELTEFIQSLPVNEQNSLSLITEKIRTRHGEMKKYEAYLLCLETFQNND